MSRRSFAVLAGVGLLLFACTPGEEKGGAAPAPIPRRAPPPVPAPSERSDAAAPALGVAVPLRFLAIGGGSAPDSTQVSLEQDIDLILRALPPPGLVLFAGGTRSHSVRELTAELPGDPVLLALGNLLSPRAGRDSRYRPPRFIAERATLENVEASLSLALAVGEAPLVVHISAHGDQGEDAKSNSVALWGGRVLTVARLAELHEQHRRPLRLVATSCFSGGFAELAFAHADVNAGPTQVPRCGLFAGTWDRETSGCDPNPDRRAQESYSLHFTHALSGTRKDGTPLLLGDVDYDRDGRVGLLDAHTWARIQALSFDVPTTTSERWLRRVQRATAPLDEKLLPEEAAVIRELGKALGLADRDAVTKRWDDLHQRLMSISEQRAEAEAILAEREAEQAMSLLERWPVLDDPFHPDFAATFEQNRDAIMQALTDTKEARARALMMGRVQALDDELGLVGLEEARVLRLSRAYETLHKAAALMKKGGPAAQHYARLLACERGAP